MPSSPSGQGTLDVDRGPEQGPRIDAPATPPAPTIRLDLGRVPVQRARELVVTLAATGEAELAAIVRRELEDLDRPPF